MSQTGGYDESRSPVNPELISAFYDQETTPEERALVELWMDDSSDTLQILDDYDQLSQILRSLHQVDQKPRLRKPVMERVQGIVVSRSQSARISEPPTSPPRSRRNRMYATVAGLATVAAIVVLVAWPNVPPATEGTVALGNRTTDTGGSLAQEAVLSDISGASDGMRSMAAPAAAALAPQSDAEGSASGRQPSPSEMEAEVADSLAQMIRERPLPQAGDVLAYLDQNADELTWVAVTVVDAQDIGDKVRLLLARHGVESATGETDSVAGESADSPAVADAAGDPQEHVTFVVEADWDRMEAVIVDLTDATFVGAMQVDPPADEDVPEELKGYAFDRSGQPGVPPGSEKIRQRVQDRSRSVVQARDNNPEEPEALQLQAVFSDEDLQRIASKRETDSPAEENVASAGRGEPAPPAVERDPGSLGVPLASRRAKFVLVIQQQDD